MPVPRRRRTPLGNRRRAAEDGYLFKALRVTPELWAQLEAVAVKESISLNAVCLALFEVALGLEDGEARIHQACTHWRTRYEHRWSQQRQQRLLAAEDEVR